MRSGESEMGRLIVNYIGSTNDPVKQEIVVLINILQTSQANESPRARFFSRRCAAAATILAAIIAPPFSGGFDIAKAQSGDAAASASQKLTSVDYNFVAQANLGAPFQIDSGRVAEKKATMAAIRDYAHLMVVTHIPVVDALNKILAQKSIEAPPNTLLQGAYRTMVASLQAEGGTALDRDYVEGQVDYQKGNAALFQNEIENGNDPDLKAFARATLPKVEDHLGRALKLAEKRAAAK
jgi:putative membrane protein